MFCNVVYARLAANCLEAKDRERLDRELYAPVIGWKAAERNLWQRIMTAGEG